MASREQRLAALAVRVGAGVQPGQDVVVLAFDVEQAPIARAVAEAAYAEGAHFVSVLYWDQHVKRIRLRQAPSDSLGFLPDWWTRMVAECVETAVGRHHHLGRSSPRAPRRDSLRSAGQRSHAAHPRSLRGCQSG